MANLKENALRIKGGAEEIKSIILAGGQSAEHIQEYNGLLAKRIADKPVEQYWQETRVSANGSSIDSGLAVIQGLKGKAIKVNQLFSLQEYDERAGLAIHTSSNGKFTIVGTTTQSVAFGIYNVSLDNRPHKFVVKAKTTKASSSTFTLWLKSNYSQYVAVGNSVGDTTAIVNCTTDGSSLIFVIDVAEGNIYDWEGSIQAIDLTELGWDDITTYDEFKARWKTYYGSEELPNYFTEGEILVSKPSKLISSDSEISIELNPLFSEDGILSVGDVADEWTNKAIKRVGVVKMKDMSWALAGSSLFSANLPSPIPTITGADKAPLLCGRFSVVDQNSWGANDNEIFVQVYGGGFKEVLVHCNSYTDVASFVASLTDDDILLYELATPIEEDIPFPVDFYKVEQNGTELILGEGGNPTLIDAYIGYKGMDTLANLASAWGIDKEKVGKVIVNGTENWQLADSGYYAGLFVLRIDALPIGSADGKCSCGLYKAWNNANPTGMPDGYIIGPSGYYASDFFTSGIRDNRFTSLDAWKAHLAELYANGCPLTIYYEKN